VGGDFDLYKTELLPYKRIRQSSTYIKKNIKLFTIKLMLLYISSFFISRVLILKMMMPFGIAFFIAAYIETDKKISLITGLSAVIGTLSASAGYTSLNHVITILIMVIITQMINSNSKRNSYKLLITASIINFALNLSFHILFISGGFVLYDLYIALIESILVAASSYIFSFGVPIFTNKNKRMIFKREEIICLGLISAIVIAGFFDVKFKGLSIKNMIVFFIVLASGYMEGPAMGAASGVSLGIVSSISDVTMPLSLGIYGFCGLIAGIFKDTGKIISAIAFAASSAMLTFYAAGLFNIKMLFMDSLVPCILFLVIPEKIYERFILLFDDTRRKEEIEMSYVDKIKGIIDLRMSSIQNTVSGLSEILEKNINNELSRKNEINGMVEKLANKVCTSCDSRSFCWKRELYYTYDMFIELFEKIQSKGKLQMASLPENIKKKCIKPFEIANEANNLIEILRVNNMWRKKLNNSKKIVAGEIKDISEIIKSIMNDVTSSMEFKNDVEEEISAELDSSGLEFDNVLAVKNKKGRMEVTIYKKPCLGKQLCTKKFAPAVSRILGIKMIRDGSNCMLSREYPMCQFRLIEDINYNIITAVSKLAKEEISGDNYTYGKAGQGKYMAALSDGMGSGKFASNESSTTITLLEKLLEAGFDRNEAIRAINSILVLRLCDESFATIDLCLIDMYSGMTEFIKVGSAPAFIKSGMEINVINSMSMPVGILDDIEIESEIMQLKNGDMIIMVTDGAVDSSPDKEKWIVKALQGYDCGNPKDVAEYLIRCARDNYGDKIGDDITVMVSKVWKVM
jgi:stage II sporulation protein E